MVDTTQLTHEEAKEAFGAKDCMINFDNRYHKGEFEVSYNQYEKMSESYEAIRR